MNSSCNNAFVFRLDFLFKLLRSQSVLIKFYMDSMFLHFSGRFFIFRLDFYIFSGYITMSSVIDAGITDDMILFFRTYFEHIFIAEFKVFLLS